MKGIPKLRLGTRNERHSVTPFGNEERGKIDFKSLSLSTEEQKTMNSLQETMNSLVAVPRNGYLPVSFEQERLWVAEQLKPTSTASNIGVIGVQLTGQLNIAALEQSLNDIVQRHEILRTTFAMVEGHLAQIIAPHINWTLSVKDCQNLEKSKQSSVIAQIAKEEGQQPFNLSQGPLWRFKLLRLGESDYLLLWIINHIICDGLSLMLFLRELTILYEAFCLEKPSPLPEISIQYGDFVVWQRQWLQSKDLDKSLAYWKKRLDGMPPLLELPIDRPRPLSRHFQTAQKLFQLSANLLSEIQQLSEKQNVTNFTILMAGFKALLYQYSGQEDIIIGVPTSGRVHQKVESLIGLFSYPLVLRTDLSGNPSFLELLGRVRNTLVDAYSHKHIPLEKVVEVVEPERSPQYNPLIQVVFSFVKHLDSINLPNLTITLLAEAISTPTDLDLFLRMYQVDDVLHGAVEYQTDIFDAKTIETFVNSYCQILEQGVHSPETKLSEFELSHKLNLKDTRQLETQRKLAISATFTAEPVADSLDFWLKALEFDYQIEFALYNQVFQQLLNPDSLLAQNQQGINIILVRFEDWLRFADESKEQGDMLTRFYRDIERNVQELILALKGAAARLSCHNLVFVCPAAPVTVATQERATFLQKMEAKIVAELSDMTGISVITTTELSTTYPVTRFYNPEGDKLGHIPFTPLFFTALGTMIARKIYAIQNIPYKVIVLDCDQTLWQGICGEDGTDGIIISPPHQALQEFMLAQHDQGILLCLCSKNHEDDVIHVFKHRFEMPLQLQHFVCWRINWQPKSENLKSMSQELQLGLDSFIFIDDNPVECAEIQANCPEVLTLQLPEKTNSIPTFLRHIWAFDRLKVTAEDHQRTAFYQQNIQREQLRGKSLTLGDFLSSLGLQIQMKEMVSSQIARVAQLTQRTNQFNATTIRRTETEIQNIFHSEEYTCLVVDVKDRFGDYGLVGVIIFTVTADTLEIDTFLLSCRVLGRGIEYQMLAKLGDIARKRQIDWVDVTYKPTHKNQPIRDFLEQVGSEFNKPLEKGEHFQFPVAFCQAIVYRPKSIEASDDLSAKPKPFAPVPIGMRANFVLLNRIATQLYEPEQILLQIEAKTTHSQNRQKSLVLPRTEIETQLVELWEKALHLEKISIYDNFFDLGGNSLLAVQLMFYVRETFQVELPLNQLLNVPTLAELAQVIEAIQCSKTGAIETTVNESIKDAEARLNEKTTLFQQTDSILVGIQSHGSMLPLFCLHHTFGSIFPYVNLARHLHSEQPTYGIQSPLFVGKKDYSSMKDRAAHYIEVIKQVQPEGPYLLAGMSYGGNLAVEMAIQLKRQGKEVALVALFDSYPASLQSYKYSLKDSMNLLVAFPEMREIIFREQLNKQRKVSYDDLQQLSEEELWSYMFQHADDRFIDIQQEIPQLVLMCAKNCIDEVNKHTLQVYPERITLFLANDKLFSENNEILSKFNVDEKFFIEEWSQTSSQPIEKIMVPGNHTTMLDEPNVQILAERLMVVLKRIQREYAIS
jgi:FkbH-like protein